MRQISSVATIALIGMGLAGCTNETYSGGFRTWSGDPIHRTKTHGPEIEKDRIYESDQMYRQNVLYNLDFPRGLTPSQVVAKAQALVGAEMAPGSNTQDVDPRTGRRIVIRGRFGPIEEDMAWTVLANAIEMGSHNELLAYSETGFPWEKGKVLIYSEPTDEFVLLNKRQTQSQAKKKK